MDIVHRSRNTDDFIYNIFGKQFSQFPNISKFVVINEIVNFNGLYDFDLYF